MEIRFREYYGKLLKQLSLEFNCTPAGLLAKENIITIPSLNEGRRIYSPDKPFLQMVTLGANTVIMADECLHEFLHDWIKNKEGHRLFEFDNLTKLNGELKKYGYQLNNTHHMFLPCRNINVEENCQVKWLYDSEIRPFNGTATANIRSQNIALNSGFKPAWVETEAIKIA